MKIQVIASKPAHQLFPIISWGIRLIEWSKQSHVTIYFPDKDLVRHAHFNNIEEVHINKFLEKNKIVNMKNIELTEEQYKKIDEWTKSKIGKQEGYFCTLFGNLIPQIIRNVFHKMISNPLTKGLTCSEYVRTALRQADPVWVFVLTNEIPNGTFTTTDAIDLAEEFNNK